MKVLVIGSRVPYPLHDGGAIATFNMLKGIAEIGCEVDFITLNTHKHFIETDIAKQKMPFLKSYVDFEINTNINPFDAFFNLFSNKSYNIERFYNQKFEQILVARIEAKKYDIIHFEGLFVGKYLLAINSLLEYSSATITYDTKVGDGPALVLRQHNIEFQIWERLAQNEPNIFKKLYLKLLAKRLKKFEKEITSGFKYISTIAKTDEDTLNEWKTCSIIKTIPSGYDVKPMVPVPLDNNSIYHIGSMEWMPNIEAMQWFIQKIFPLVVAKNKLAKFYVAGKKMPLEFSQFQSENIEIVGEVADLENFIGGKSILVVPLKSGSGIRIKTIEAMMQGKAVITTTTGAQGLLIKHYEHCLIADTEKEMAEAILLLLSDISLRNKIALAGQELMKSVYDNKVVAKQWLNFYEEIILQINR
ncbi:MAG: glycosyltransferase [Bacteroidetes bacterium]|nr:glycosyltransferase [Bacteroidota bacterium]